MMVTTAWHEEIETLLGQTMRELGFANVDQSISHLLYYLKTVSGRLALQVLESPTSAAAAVGLGIVTAQLQNAGRLKQAVLIPVDAYPRLFSQEGSGSPLKGERRCDLVLVSLRRNIVDATFIEVKWRRGQAPLQELAEDMALQMEGSAQTMRNRFFRSEERVDAILQRSYLANVLRFYFERSRRYQLFDPEAEKPFMEQLARLEKTGLEFRPAYEGYIVNLEGTHRKPLLIETQTEKTKIIVLTADMLENADESSPLLPGYGTGPLPAFSPEEDEYSLDDNQPDNVNHTENRGDATDTSYSENIPADISTDEQTQPDADEIVIPLGEASGKPIVWTPGIKGSPHLFILGIPGQGKSWTATRILYELSKQDVPSLVLDFHGQFADPEEPFVQKMHPTVIDAAKGLPISPFECTQENGSGGWKATSYALAEIFAGVTGMGPMQRDIIRESQYLVMLLRKKDATGRTDGE